VAAVDALVRTDVSSGSGFVRRLMFRFLASGERENRAGDEDQAHRGGASLSIGERLVGER